MTSEIGDVVQTFIMSNGKELKPGDSCLLFGDTSRWERAVYLGGCNGLKAHNQGVSRFEKTGKIIRRGRRWVK